MKIAFVQDWLTGFAGGEQVLLALHQLYPEAPIYTSFYNPAKAPQFAGADVRTTYLQDVPGLLGRDKLAIPLMPAAFEALDLKGYDTVVSVGGGLSKGVITHPGQRHISYCHTPIRYIWRLGGDNRNERKWDSRLRDWAMHRMRLWDVVSAERVDEFIANSTTVQQRIAKIYRRDSVVVSPPVSVDQFPLSKTNDGYFLTVGRLVSYKCVDVIVEACKRTKTPLKVVGSGPEEQRYRQLAAGAPWVELLGRVSDEERNHLYANARGFIFAAEEDAGIVPVEAMACGKPVIAYGRGGVTDVVVDGTHGLFFPEQTPESLAEALGRFSDKQFDAEVIRKHAEQFSVEKFQQNMRKIIER